MFYRLVVLALSPSSNPMHRFFCFFLFAFLKCDYKMLSASFDRSLRGGGIYELIWTPHPDQSATCSRFYPCLFPVMSCCCLVFWMSDCCIANLKYIQQSRNCLNMRIQVLNCTKQYQSLWSKFHTVPISKNLSLACPDLSRSCPVSPHEVSPRVLDPFLNIYDFLSTIEIHIFFHVIIFIFRIWTIETILQFIFHYFVGNTIFR